MKEIKAYIRPLMADRVISALELAGVPGMTVIDVSTLGKGTDPERSKLSMEYCEKPIFVAIIAKLLKFS